MKSQFLAHGPLQTGSLMVCVRVFPRAFKPPHRRYNHAIGTRRIVTTPKHGQAGGGEVDTKDLQTDSDDLTASASEQRHGTSHADIAVRAYQCWCERGCPEGSPEVDWCQAEQDIRTEKAQSKPESEAAATSA